jgi:hypothetical protein
LPEVKVQAVAMRNILQLLTGTDAEATPLDESIGELTEAADILRAPRRIMVIDTLAGYTPDEVVPRNELIDALARVECGVSSSEAVSGDARTRVYVSLHQTHLPKLSAASIIDYDEDRGTVVRGARFDEILRILRVMQEVME